MGLKKKQLRTDADLTPKQKMFVEILVQDHGSITQGEALKRAGYVMKEEKGYTSYASQLLSRKYNPHVAAYYDKRFEKELQKYKSKGLSSTGFDPLVSKKATGGLIKRRATKKKNT